MNPGDHSLQIEPTGQFQLKKKNNYRLLTYCFVADLLFTMTILIL